MENAVPKDDNEMQATEAEIPIIQPIIDQIREGNIKQALEAIEALDKTVIDKVILKELFDESDSILKAAVEQGAFEIINKLIEKKCNLLEERVFNNLISGTMDDALSLWFKTVANLTSYGAISANLFSTGRTLLEASQKTLLDETIFQLIKEWIPREDLPAILYGLLGAEKFIQLLFFSRGEDLKYLKYIIGSTPAFRGCLNILTENAVKITEDTLFMLHLIALSVPTNQADDFYLALHEYSQALNKNLIPTEKKSLSESEFKVLLEPQVTSPMNDFPEAEYWRLFVDGLQQISSKEHGWRGYEIREPHCIQKMYDAFVYARENLETEQLSYELTDEIHRIATGHFATGHEKDVSKNFRTPSNILKISQDRKKNGLPGLDGLTNGLPALINGLSVGTLTYQGLLEITKEPYKSWYSLKNRTHLRDKNFDPTHVIATFSDNNCKNEGHAIATIKKIIEEYHQNLEVAIKAKDRIKQLQCIIKLASDYARYHPYTDGNNRTAVCILNRELQKHGFPLAILSDPNELEGHSQAELFTKICQGMQNFLRVKAGAPYPGSKTTDEFRTENRIPPPIQLTQPTLKIKFH
jgi:hypothetical protein